MRAYWARCLSLCQTKPKEQATSVTMEDHEGFRTLLLDTLIINGSSRRGPGQTEKITK